MSQVVEDLKKENINSNKLLVRTNMCSAESAKEQIQLT